jgi:hypothetical protein
VGQTSEPRGIPTLALRREEAPVAIGVSPDFFRQHVAHELRWVRRGRLQLVSVEELTRWLRENGERVFDHEDAT